MYFKVAFISSSSLYFLNSSSLSSSLIISLCCYKEVYYFANIAVLSFFIGSFILWRLSFEFVSGPAVLENTKQIYLTNQKMNLPSLAGLLATSFYSLESSNGCIYVLLLLFWLAELSLADKIYYLLTTLIYELYTFTPSINRSIKINLNN